MFTVLIVSLVVGLGVRLAGKSGAMSLNYTAASTNMKFHVVYLLWVPQMINFWPPFYVVINQLRFFVPFTPNGNQSVTEHLSRSYSKIAPSVIA